MGGEGGLCVHSPKDCLIDVFGVTVAQVIQRVHLRGGWGGGDGAGLGGSYERMCIPWSLPTFVCSALWNSSHVTISTWWDM